mgnify:CR=1 FL=1
MRYSAGMTDDKSPWWENFTHMDETLASKADIERLIDAWGFLPFFRSAVQGLSIEEHIASRYWFGAEAGAWEWKGAIIRDGYVYGKLFGRKCGFATLEWYRQLANWRRDGYDFDVRTDDGLAPHQDQHLYNALLPFGQLQSKGLKAAAGFDKAGGRTGFETIITRLQMQCYVCVADFPYLTDKHGKEYGWGVTEYTTPEALYGTRFTEGLYDMEPEASKERIRAHLAGLFPAATDAQIQRIIGANV